MAIAQTVINMAIDAEIHHTVWRVMGLNAWKIRTWADYAAQKRMARTHVRATRPLADWSHLLEA